MTTSESRSYGDGNANLIGCNLGSAYELIIDLKTLGLKSPNLPKISSEVSLPSGKVCFAKV